MTNLARRPCRRPSLGRVREDAGSDGEGAGHLGSPAREGVPRKEGRGRSEGWGGRSSSAGVGVDERERATTRLDIIHYDSRSALQGTAAVRGASPSREVPLPGCPMMAVRNHLSSLPTIARCREAVRITCASWRQLADQVSNPLGPLSSPDRVGKVRRTRLIAMRLCDGGHVDRSGEDGTSKLWVRAARELERGLMATRGRRCESRRTLEREGDDTASG